MQSVRRSAPQHAWRSDMSWSCCLPQQQAVELLLDAADDVLRARGVQVDGKFDPAAAQVWAGDGHARSKHGHYPQDFPTRIS